MLLVDDDERNLRRRERARGPWRSRARPIGEEALRHLLRGEFAVILLDVYMPGMDGYETAQIIRKREQTKGIPIVFLSAEQGDRASDARLFDGRRRLCSSRSTRRPALDVFVDLFAKTKEIERKAAQEQALNAELLRAEQELRRAEQRQAAIIQSLPMVLYLELSKRWTAGRIM